MGEGNRVDEAVVGRFGVWYRNAKGEMLVDFAIIIKTAGECILPENQGDIEEWREKHTS